MGDINITFTNNTSDSHHWEIADRGIDPSYPKLIFSDYLDTAASTSPLAVHDSGSIEYKRADGPTQLVDNLHDGDTVRME
jgi:hypothetical protein